MKKNDLKLPGGISVQKLFGTEPGTEAFHIFLTLYML